MLDKKKKKIGISNHWLWEEIYYFDVISYSALTHYSVSNY